MPQHITSTERSETKEGVVSGGARSGRRSALEVAMVSAVYPPEPVGSAQMTRDLAVYLASVGAQPVVICPSPSRPMGATYADLPCRRRPLVRVEEGVRVVRLPSYTAPESKLVPRMLESLSFGRHACRYLSEHLPNTDVVYACAWPLLANGLIGRYCTLRGLPLILHIQDIYPESVLGRLPAFSRSITGGLLTALDRWTAMGARKTVVISENMRNTYVAGRGLDPGKVVMVAGWMDEGRFERLPVREEACARYGVPREPFTFLYLGNVGPVAGVDWLITSYHAAGLNGTQLVIAGDGSAKAACVARARMLGVSSVRFISDPEAGSVPLLQALGHVCLLPVRKGAGMSSIPSKLMAYMFSAKPVIASVDAESDTARTISRAGCGWVEAPEDSAQLGRRLREVAALPADELDWVGRKGRLYALAHHSMGASVRRLAQVMLDCAPVSAARAPKSGRVV